MLNKLFVLILLYSPNVFLCMELNNLNLYKASTQTNDKDNPESKVESTEKQSVTSPDVSTSEKDDTETKENSES